jgi:type VI secretion system secreted protein VgrG
VTNTGPTTIIGDVGLYPGPSVTGFVDPPANTVVEGPGSTGLINGPGLVDGTIYISHADAQQGQIDNTTAYNGLAAMPFTTDLTGVDLGGSVLTSGVYHFDTAAQLTGTLTLDAQGLNNAFWVFQIGSTLTTASASVVEMINVGSNNGSDNGLFWQVGSSATLGTSTNFEGNILALASITLNTTATIHNGRALAQTGAVTLDTNTLTITSPFPNEGTLSGGLEFDNNGDVVPIGPSASVVPEPGTFLMCSSWLAGLLCFRKRFGSVA